MCMVWYDTYLELEFIGRECHWDNNMCFDDNRVQDALNNLFILNNMIRMRNLMLDEKKKSLNLIMQQILLIDKNPLAWK